MTFGEIIIVNFQGATGVKRRPAIIISSDEYHKTRPDVILAVITTQTSSAISTTDYLPEDWKTAGLHKPSAFRAYFGTYDKRAIASVIGKVSDRDWYEIQKRINLAIAAG
jgi:mRNA interferase MazF